MSDRSADMNPGRDEQIGSGRDSYRSPKRGL
jgi:ABC-type Fe3+/spermidine/putrescine transport system ATPase subunit